MVTSCPLMSVGSGIGLRKFDRSRLGKNAQLGLRELTLQYIRAAAIESRLLWYRRESVIGQEEVDRVPCIGIGGPLQLSKRAKVSPMVGAGATVSGTDWNLILIENHQLDAKIMTHPVHDAERRLPFHAESASLHGVMRGDGKRRIGGESPAALDRRRRGGRRNDRGFGR